MFMGRGRSSASGAVGGRLRQERARNAFLGAGVRAGMGSISLGCRAAGRQNGRDRMGAGGAGPARHKGLAQQTSREMQRSTEISKTDRENTQVYLQAAVPLMSATS